MRLSDITVISMNDDMLVKDKRLKVLHTSPNRWVLRIDDVSVDDDSNYECQVTTAIKTSSIVHLKVLGIFTTLCHFYFTQKSVCR